MTKPRASRQSDLELAISAAQRAGLTISGVRISVDGTIEVMTSAPTAPAPRAAKEAGLVQVPQAAEPPSDRSQTKAEPAAAQARAYTINEAAAAVGLSRSSLYRVIRMGELEMGKFHGRSVIKPDVLRAWFDQQYQPARPGRRLPGAELSPRPLSPVALEGVKRGAE